jgi:hypothetical protein
MVVGNKSQLYDTKAAQTLARTSEFMIHATLNAPPDPKRHSVDRQQPPDNRVFANFARAICG